MNPEVASWIAAIPEEHIALFERLRDIILSVDPDAEMSVNGKNLQFTNEYGKMWIGRFKGGLSVFTGNMHRVQEFIAKHPELPGTGSIAKFRPGDKIPVRDLKTLIKSALAAQK